MLNLIKVILFGVVTGVTQWLPVSSSAHLMIARRILHPVDSKAFTQMLFVAIHLGAVSAVLFIYRRGLNPWSKKKNEKQKLLTWQLWIKIAIACLPAAIVGLIFHDYLDEIFSKPLPIALVLIFYGVLFVMIEDRIRTKEPRAYKISQLTLQMLFWIGVFQMLALIPGTSRTGLTIIGAVLAGFARLPAARFAFFLTVPLTIGESILTLSQTGVPLSGQEPLYLLLGYAISFGVSCITIKLFLRYINNHDFKYFGYYRILLGVLILLWVMFRALF